ncbi:MAG: PhzF family phenazine biosynthesis protein [candidate division WOR-3 bacterium]
MKSRWLKAKRLSAFSGEPYAGNPAWVILGAEELTDEQMQILAAELNPLSDTAFLQITPSQDADLVLKFFSQGGEIGFSGHATVATYFALSGEDIFPLKEPITAIRQKTKSGIQYIELRVAENKVHRVTISVGGPKFVTNEFNIVAIGRMLGIPPKEITDTNLPLDTVSTGFYSVIVPVKNLSQLLDLKPDFALIEKFCNRIGAAGIQVFTLETFEKESDAHVRHFAPAVGIPEDPVSGGACASLGCYLVRYRLIPVDHFNRIIIEQGQNQKKMGKVYVHVQLYKDQIAVVKVGGQAVVTFEGMISIP